MKYKYAAKENYEDYASGRVLYHKSGLSTFPVRLANEIFLRAHYLFSLEPNKINPLILYDPLCGEGYLMTVLAMLHSNKIERVIGSDINPDALDIARKNFSLLKTAGLQKRKNQLTALFNTYQKASHQVALQTLERFILKSKSNKRSTQTKTFKADLLSPDALYESSFKADIIITDLPYGKLAHWKNGNINEANLFLKHLLPVVHEATVLAIISNKTQKINSEYFRRVEKFQIGKRRIEFLKRK